MARIIPFLAIAILGSAYALPSPQNSSCSQRIVGGYEIDIADAPFQVALLETHGQHCCGSLISSRWVLTAAHCVGRFENPSMTIRIGSSYYAEGGLLTTVKRSVQHPLYDYAVLDYDFALLELADEVQLTDDFYAVELPLQDEPVRDGTCLQVSGWGATQNPLESQDVLRAANVPVVNQEQCVDSYQGIMPVSDRMICAGYESGGKGACNGDSGGPLVDGSTLVGVVSWVKGCADEGFPVVYARVAAVRDWIRETSGV